MNTISEIHSDTEKKNVHHLLSRKFGGNSHGSNKSKINQNVHDAYNQISNGGCIPSVRFITHHLIRSLEHSQTIINADAVNELLERLTPMDWRTCYIPNSLSNATRSSDYEDEKAFAIAQNWLDVIDHEEYLVRRTMGGILKTKHGHTRNTRLMATMEFFETEDPMEVIENYVSSDEFCSNLQSELRKRIKSIVKDEKPRRRTETREKAIVEVMRRQRGRLKSVETVWYPIDKFDMCLAKAITERYRNNGTD